MFAGMTLNKLKSKHLMVFQYSFHINKITLKHLYIH